MVVKVMESGAQLRLTLEFMFMFLGVIWYLYRIYNGFISYHLKGDYFKVN